MSNLATVRTAAEAAALIRFERNQRGWTARELARKVREAALTAGEDLDLTQQAISFLETGKAKTLPRWLRYAHNAFATHAVTRSPGLEASSPVQMGKEGDAFLSPVELGLVKIPEIDLGVAMGADARFIDQPSINKVDRWFSKDWVNTFTDTAPPLLAFARALGDSMYPTIGGDDLVLIDRLHTTIDRVDAIWLLIFGDFSTLKRVRLLPDGTARLMADNLQVQDEKAKPDELYVIGRIVGVFRRT